MLTVRLAPPNVELQAFCKTSATFRAPLYFLVCCHTVNKFDQSTCKEAYSLVENHRCGTLAT